MEPAFVSVDLESSLGIIKDDDAHLIAATNTASTDAQFVCQTTNTNQSPALGPSYETLPMIMDNNNNQKVTRTSATYPFANQEQQQQEENQMEGDDDDDAMMDESDAPEEEEKKENAISSSSSSPLSSSPQQTCGMSSFEPIPVSDETADLSMMMLLQDDEAKEVLVNRISDWTPNSNSSNHFQSSSSNEKKGYNIVPNDMNWVTIDLSETEVDEEDEQSLLCMLEEEAKEPGFVLEDIGDRQSFWNNGDD